MAPKWTNKWGHWAKAQEGAWSWNDEAKSKPEDKPKNWRCPVCSFTGNCPWWSKCGRESCGAAWAPKEAEAPTPSSSAEPTKAQELAMTREELCCLVKLLPEGHATILEYASKVKALEDEQKNSVSAAERLRRLLQTQKSLEGKEVAARTAKDKAKVDLAKASAALRLRMEECEAVVAELAANALEVAELTRSVAPEPTANTAGSIDMCQELRGQIDILQPSDLAEAGLNMSGMGEFF